MSRGVSIGLALVLFTPGYAGAAFGVRNPAPVTPVKLARPKPTVTRVTVVRLEVAPLAVELVGQGDRDRVFVAAVLSDGSTKDVTERTLLSLSGPAVRLDGRHLVAAGDGKALLTVAYGGVRTSVPVRCRATAAPRAPSFRYDVLPTLTRAGCNQGACHGNTEGKGGLRLSLRGEDPEYDYRVMARDGGGRRINRAAPGASLLLLKATSAVPHGGGRRFSAASEEYARVAGWIAAGAPEDGPDAPSLLRLEVEPKERVLIAPAKGQRLVVRGQFSDGTVRNLAQQACYDSGDQQVTVSEDGWVSVRDSGDAAVLVRYADQMATARLTFVPARPQFRWSAPAPANWIDEINFRRLRTLRLAPSRLATDSELIRRAYLDLLGVLPTPDEVRAFLADTRPDKRARLIDALLQRPEHADFWTMKWADVLRLEERSLDPKGVTAYQSWIRQCIAENKPLDAFAREQLTATGGTYANPPANYYRRTRDPLNLAENTAQVFMGTRLLCAKCHNHPFEAWKQDDYYALAAFFARVDRKIENVTRKDKFDLHELIGEEMIASSPKGDVEHPRLRRNQEPHLPSVVPIADRQRIDRELQQETDRRVPFARWLTTPENPFFARAMANRTWYHLFGRGIVDPVDDLRSSNPASNPELLDALARELTRSRFDGRALIRTIMNSRTYQLSAEPNETNREDERYFSRAIAQRLGAEVLLDGISQVTGVTETFTGFPEGTRAVQLYAQKQKHPFLKLFGQPARESACECERSSETTLNQSFALISGPLLNGKLAKPENRIGALLKQGAPDEQIVTELYLSAVSREPTSREAESAVRYVRSKADRRAGLEDFAWALLNSKEFLLRR